MASLDFRTRWVVLFVVAALSAQGCSKDAKPDVVPERADLSCKPCTADDECGSGACIALDDGPRACLRSCGDGCATGYACAASGPGAGRCVPAAGSCACTAAAEGLTRACSRSSVAGTCVGLETCAAATGWGACSAATPVAETCNGTDDDCDGTVDDGDPEGGGTCATGGQGVCAAGVVHCQGGAPSCVQTAASSAETCNGLDDDCDGTADDGNPGGGGPCSTGGQGVCSAGVLHCQGGAVSCVQTTAAGSETCNGLDDDCDGAADDGALWANRGEPCSVGAGICARGGFRICNSGNPAGPTICSATAADSAPEMCNGLDDDCDGTVDDDWPNRGAACSVGIGVCARVGSWTCNAEGSATVCSGNLVGGTSETCNGLDDDCDGGVDEDFKVSGKYGVLEHCGACGLSCVGAVANGVAYCDATVAFPRCAVGSCDAGFLPVNGTCLPQSLGLCEPCLGDDNCALPGATCALLDDGKFCANPCAGSACPAGFSCRDVVPGTARCLPDTNACGCDGSNTTLVRACGVDHDPGGGLPGYACYGTSACGSTGWSACLLPAETCNYFDDDCDGTVDEGFLDASGRYASDQHCGACGVDCTALSIGGGAGACNTLADPPVCSVACTSSCFDANLDPADGCECCDPQPDDLPDASGTDANCDGIDGTISNAVFVATWGADSAETGSRAAPKRTIQAGIATALAQGKRDVLVEGGLYEESISLVPFVGVYGGYGAGFARRDPATHLTVLRAPTGTTLGAVNAIGVANRPAASTVLEGFTVHGVPQATVGAPSYAVYLRNVDASVAIRNNRIVGGVGSDGATAPDGDAGADGGSGSDGVAALDTGIADRTLCTAANASAGGLGGAPSCGAVTAGGAGGIRACPALDLGGIPVAPVATEHGQLGGGNASGGLPGWDVLHMAFSCLGYDTFGATAGGDGTTGQNGLNGAGASDCGASLGGVSGGQWVPSNAGGGNPGQPGSGGGGGGSGAGAAVHSSCFAKGFGYDNLGGTGGGGGGGGCGGAAGVGGQGGGAALSVFVAFDTAPATIPTISGNVLVGGVGGSGGAGGAGGPGGAAGRGAAGGAGGGIVDPVDPVYPAFAGGRGGDGGAGGHGGGGGGGCGGPVLGIFAAGQGTANLSAWKSGNTWQPGTGGPGGAGGYSLGQRGLTGAAGAVQVANF